MDASWPVAGKVDQPLLKSADYLADRAHDFRVRIKAMMNPKGKKVRTIKVKQRYSGSSIKGHLHKIAISLQRQRIYRGWPFWIHCAV